MRIIWIILCGASIALLTACERKPPELRLVTPSSPIDREVVEDLGRLFQHERVLTNVQLTEEALSGEAALDAIASGQADLALVTNNLDFRSDVATVMPLYPTVLHIARRPEMGANLGPGDLRGATVFAGAEGSASRLLFDRIAQRTGLGPEDYDYLTDPSAVPDVVVVFAPIAPERLSEFPHQLVLSSLGTPEDIGAGGIVDAAVLINPHFRPFIIPLGTYGAATPEPIVTIAVDKILVARRNLDTSVIYDLINDILRLRPALAAQRPGLFQQLSAEFDASRSRFVLHAGALAYLQRDAPTVYERYSGVAEVTVTVFVALVSASFAAVRIFQRRRKNRIDRFYSAAIEIRDSISTGSGDDERAAAVDKIRALQNDAFDQLVHEKLAADESFRIFITLSHDVLRQLGVEEIPAE